MRASVKFHRFARGEISTCVMFKTTIIIVMSVARYYCCDVRAIHIAIPLTNGYHAALVCFNDDVVIWFCLIIVTTRYYVEKGMLTFRWENKKARVWLNFCLLHSMRRRLLQFCGSIAAAVFSKSKVYHTGLVNFNSTTSLYTHIHTHTHTRTRTRAHSGLLPRMCKIAGNDFRNESHISSTNSGSFVHSVAFCRPYCCLCCYTYLVWNLIWWRRTQSPNSPYYTRLSCWRGDLWKLN